MTKKSTVSTIIILIAVVLLRSLSKVYPWVGFPFGIACILFPKAAWIVTGGFAYLPVEPSTFALRSRQVFGALLIVYSIYRFAFGL